MKIHRIVMVDEKRLKKLPQWAQRYIGKLQRDNTALRQDTMNLIANMRKIAAENECQARMALSPTWQAHNEGRAAAYRLAADWLKQLIPNEEISDAQVS